MEARHRIGCLEKTPKTWYRLKVRRNVFGGGDRKDMCAYRGSMETDKPLWLRGTCVRRVMGNVSENQLGKRAWWPSGFC